MPVYLIVDEWSTDYSDGNEIDVYATYDAAYARYNALKLISHENDEPCGKCIVEDVDLSSTKRNCWYYRTDSDNWINHRRLELRVEDVKST